MDHWSLLVLFRIVLTINGDNGGAFVSPGCNSAIYATGNIFKDIYGVDTATNPRMVFGDGSEENWEKITSSNSNSGLNDCKHFEFVNDKINDEFAFGFFSSAIGYWSYCTYNGAFVGANDEILMGFLTVDGGEIQIKLQQLMLIKQL